MKNNADIVIQLTRIFWMKLNRTLIIIFIIAGLLPPFFFRLIAVYNGKPFGTFSEVLLNLVISVVMTVTIACGVVTVMIWLNKRFPWREGIFKRLILEFTLTLLTACTLVTVLNVLLYFLNFLTIKLIIAASLITYYFLTERRWKEMACLLRSYGKRSSLQCNINNTSIPCRMLL